MAVRTSRVLALGVVWVAAAAWALVVWPSPVNHHPAGHVHGAPSGVDTATLGAAIVAWLLMVIAMMVPTALPMLEVLNRLVAGRRRHLLLLALGVGTFLAVWIAVGVLLVIGSTLVGQWSWHRQVVAGIVLAGAGAYQFSPLKNACLRACRTPRSFAFAHWRGRRPAGVEVLALTGAYARSCVGCCWALMAVCFAVGAAALPVMVALSALMAAERLVSWGPRLVRPLGILLIGSGVVVVAAGLIPGG